MSPSTTHRRPLGQLFDSMARLLASWWQVDRIRISPREGRLLSLRPGSLISVEERIVEVVSRTVRQSAEGPLVVYGCRSADGPGRLCVSSRDGRADDRIGWHIDGRERTLSEPDVIVYRTRRDDR